ncbi:MAG: hypothetical protein R3248_15210 [Candidatus Promineifilaceae bacterium]|nr:hypothetical protein [Candidatus Promineifilaceae bacterium]
MKKTGKNYRILSENGEALLIPARSFHCILRSLAILAEGSPAERQKDPRKK